MTNQEDLQEQLDRLGRAVAPAPSIAEDVLRGIEGAGRPRTGIGGRSFLAAAGVLFALGIGAGLPLGALLGGRAQPPSAPAVGMHIAGLKGVVLVKHRGAEAWTRLETSSPVRLGDTLQSLANSTLSLSLQDGSTITLEPFSTFQVSRCDGRVELGLDHGLLRARLNGRRGPLVITTPHGAVEALGTEFTVSVD